jgi:hypothetical protein
VPERGIEYRLSLDSQTLELRLIFGLQEHFGSGLHESLLYRSHAICD